jgi:hypothetical protein
MQREFVQPNENLHNWDDDGLVGMSPVEALGGTTETECDPSLVPCGIFVSLGLVGLGAAA